MLETRAGPRRDRHDLAERRDRGSANRCLANDNVPLHAPTEMLGPCLAPWVEQAHDVSCERVGSRYPIPLVIVAHRAGGPEILLDGEPAERPRDDVIDLHPRASDAR